MVTYQTTKRFQIEQIWTHNFRSIEHAMVDLEQLTVLVGPNASGKSNVLDILRFIKDALQRDLDAAVSIRQGFDAISRRVSNRISSKFEIGLRATMRSVEPQSYYTIDYSFCLTGLDDNSFQVESESATIYSFEEHELIVEFRIEKGNIVSPKPLVRSKIEPQLIPDEYETDFDPNDLALPTLFRFRGSINRLSDELDSSNHAIYDAFRTLNIFFRHLRNMRFYHIFPNTIREPQKIMNANYLEENAVNLASLLRELEKGNPVFLSRLRTGLSSLIPGVVNLEVASVGGYLVVRLQHKSDGWEEWFDLSQESDGTLRLLGLLTALNQRYVPLIGIEEPELTVHPGTMPALADLLKEFSKRSQLIITTHSPDFIDCVSDYRTVDSLRVVNNVEGVTTVGPVSHDNVETVKRHLFSPGDLHRMGELTTMQSS